MLRKAALFGIRAIWHGPFYVGPLTRPIYLGDALLKVLEVFWRLVVLMVAGAAIISGLAGGYAAVDQMMKPPPLENFISIEAGYDPKVCNEASHPVLIVIKNRSTRSMGSVHFNLIVRHRGQSTNLNNSPYAWESDTILPPKKMMRSCWGLPANASGEDPSKLDYRAKIDYVTEFDPGAT